MFTFSRVVRGAYRKCRCYQDYNPCVSVIYLCFLQIICAYKVPQYLLYYFYDCVHLWVLWGIRIHINTLFIFYQAIFNLLTKNSISRSYVIHTFHGYRTLLLVYTNFAIRFAFFPQYCVTSKHSLMGYINVMDFMMKGSFCFLCIFQGTRSHTHSLFHGVSSVILAGS